MVLGCHVLRSAARGPGNAVLRRWLRFGEGRAEAFLLCVPRCPVTVPARPRRNGGQETRARGERGNTAPGLGAGAWHLRAPPGSSGHLRAAPGSSGQLRARAGTAGSRGAGSRGAGKHRVAGGFVGDTPLSPPRRSSHLAVVMGTVQLWPNWSGDGG